MNTLLVQRRNLVLEITLILLLIFASFFPAKYSNSIYGYLPGIGLLSMFLLSAWYLALIRRSIRFETEAFDAVCQRGETVKAAIKIANRSALMCPKIRVDLYVSDFFGGEDTAFSSTFVLYGKSEAEFPLEIKMDHIGVYTAGVKLLRIYDFLGVFSISMKSDNNFAVTVLPKLYQTEDVHLDDRQLTESQNLQKSVISDGFDYTGVREYALGDSMKRIHWKLSSHSSTYMTKITESSRKSDLTVIIDFVTVSLDRQILPNIYDCLIETALSLTKQAASKDVESSLLFVGRDRELVRVAPKGEQDYENLVRMMPVIYSDQDSDILDGAGILEKEKHLNNKSSNLILCTSKVNDQLIQELIAVKQQQRNSELYYIVPFGESGNERYDTGAILEVLDDYDIRYHLISAEIVR